MTFYDEVGGHDTFAKIVSVFYREVALDPVLKCTPKRISALPRSDC